MPGSRTTLLHTALTLLLTAPLSCAPDPPDGQVTDPHGCRTIILPNDPNTTSSSSTTAPDATSTTSTTTDPTTTTSSTTDPTEASTTGPLPVCGDANLDDGEECDDGNATPNDGCSEQCYIERFVFVSSYGYAGNADMLEGLNGLAGADAICQTLAQYAGLITNNQTFMAWLSIDGMTPQSPSTRFPLPVTTAKGPFLLPGDAHTKIADDWADLTDGDLDHPISINESGNAVGNSTVWTNTTPQGSPAQKGDCSAWTNSANMAKAGIGSSNYADFNWTNLNDPNFCTNSARIYCFQVTP